MEDGGSNDDINEVAVKIEKEDSESNSTQSSTSPEPTDEGRSQSLKRKQPLQEELCPVDVVEGYKNDKRHVRLTFQNIDDCKKTLTKLHSTGLRGKTHINLPGSQEGERLEVIDNASDTTEVIAPSSWRPDLDIWRPDPSGMYGLRREFLKSLDISPPLDRWVHVTNFRCDKYELRDIMELAGHVLSCSVINITKRFAKVQYSHPLEAVQALSMLDGQMYFGLKLKLFMEKNPKNDIMLPRGLVNIGLGLGLHGRPVRDVVREFKNFAKQRTSQINPILFSKIPDEPFYGKEEEDMDKTEENQPDINEYIQTARNPNFLDERSFKIRHAEDLDSNDSAKAEKDAIKTPSPGSNGAKSAGSPAANHDKDNDKSNNSGTINPLPIPPQPNIPGNTIRMDIESARRFPTPNVFSNPPLMPPGLSGPEGPPQHTNPAQYQPRPIPKPMSNPIRNQPQPGPYGPALPYIPPPTTLPLSLITTNRTSAPVFSRPNPVPPMNGPRKPPPAVQNPVIGVRGPVNQDAGAGYRGICSVQFSNLPPSTTFPMLCDKLSVCGQVVSLHFTTPGCAVAIFGHPSQAERCIQHFNGMPADGCRINATYL